MARKCAAVTLFYFLIIKLAKDKKVSKVGFGTKKQCWWVEIIGEIGRFNDNSRMDCN
jgi:hypothetical protein